MGRRRASRSTTRRFPAVWRGRETANWLVFSSTRNSQPTLWRIRSSGGLPEQVPQVGVVTISPSISPQGHQLAYRQLSGSSSIWRIELTKAPKSGVQVSASRGFNWAPAFSPDGARIAFLSDRSGSMENWICSKDGTNLAQLTSFGGAPQPGPLRWSPDNQWIVFDSALGEHNAIFVLAAEGGVPRPLTHEASDSLNASWSRDGKWIYFTSNRTGQWQIWKVSSEGGEQLQVTKQGGFRVFESADGKFIYYAKTPAAPDIWRAQVDGGQESPISLQIHLQSWRDWDLTDVGILFSESGFSTHQALKFFDFATASTKELVTLQKALRVDLSIRRRQLYRCADPRTLRFSTEFAMCGMCRRIQARVG